MEAKEISILIEKYLSGKATPEEKSFVEKWYEDVSIPQDNADLDRIEQYKKETYQFLSNYIGSRDPAFAGPVPKHKRGLSVYRWLTAAMLLLTLSTVIYFYRKNTVSLKIAVAEKALINDVPPGGNKATLTLSNGKQLVLTDAKKGIVATQGNVSINKTSDGRVIYNTHKSIHPQASEFVYNTITTPAGGTYYLILTDGTRVWLNAASSIKYPVSFIGSERVVELTGEAYFEVAKNKRMPFKVRSNGQEVEVLGTHFDINSYPNELAVKTTLLEGRVKIAAAGAYTLLKPGEQAAFNASANKPVKVSGNVNLAAVTAWKNGKFVFAGADIETVMRQLERWYDVKAVYEGVRPSDHFNGTIPKSVNLSEVLKVLALSGVHFKIEGRNIIIR